MRGINKFIGIGNLGKDPETRYIQDGKAVTNISIATSESWTDKQTGEKKESTDWHRIVFFGRLAEIAGEYLKKGSKVYIEGKLKTRKWQDNTGADRYTTEIVANELQMLDSRQEKTEPAAPERPTQAPQAQQDRDWETISVVYLSAPVLSCHLRV